MKNNETIQFPWDSQTCHEYCFTLFAYIFFSNATVDNPKVYDFFASESCDCFCCSVDLRSLVEQNRPHFIPPTSRMTNYVVFRFGNLESDYNVSMSPCSFYLE